MKVKLLEELLQHISKSQGLDLHDLLQKSKKPEMPLEGCDAEELTESPPEEKTEEELDPKAISIEKVEVMKPKQGYDGKVSDAINEISKKPGISEEMPQSEDELSDEELEELLSKLNK